MGWEGRAHCIATLPFDSGASVCCMGDIVSVLHSAINLAMMQMPAMLRLACRSCRW